MASAPKEKKDQGKCLTDCLVLCCPENIHGGYTLKSLIEQLEETNRNKGIQVMLFSEVMLFSDKERGQKHPIACFVNREKWVGLTTDQQETFAKELMQKNWGEIATYRMSVED